MSHNAIQRRSLVTLVCRQQYRSHPNHRPAVPHPRISLVSTRLCHSCWFERAAEEVIECFCRGFPPEGLTGPCVEFGGDVVEVVSREHRQVSAFGKVLTQQSFVFSLVPRCHGECGSQK